jgi:Protein of unknown function (DUF1214)
VDLPCAGVCCGDTGTGVSAGDALADALVGTGGVVVLLVLGQDGAQVRQAEILKRLTITGSAGHRHLGEQLVRSRQRRALFRADKTYKLHVPVPVPVAQFWGLTLYSQSTRRPYDNGQPDLRDVNLDSCDETLQRNADDSIHLYVGPAAPQAWKATG